MSNPLSVTLHALGAEASAGSSAAVDLGELRSALELQLTVTASAQVLVTLETSPDGATGWRKAGAFKAVQGSGQRDLAFDGLDRFVRVKWDAPATFSADGTAYVLFATRKDVFAALKGAAVAECDDNTWALQLIAGSSEAETYISNANPLPITAWTPVIRQKTARLVAWGLVTSRGIDANNAADMVVKDLYDQALGWFRDVAKGVIKPPNVTPPDNLGIRTVIGGAEVASPVVGDDCGPRQFTRNWGDFG